jgi:hypothetical protein
MFTNAQTEVKFLRVYIPARKERNFKIEHRHAGVFLELTREQRQEEVSKSYKRAEI